MGLPPSPPDELTLGNSDQVIDTAEKVLKAQGEAIAALGWMFNGSNRHDGPAASFAYSLSLLKQTVQRGGKIVISGMGKSHKIGSKIVATLHSFGIPASSLHPSDALHGDVGQVDRNDIILLISASGNSPELAALVRHLPDGLQSICLTCNDHSPLAKMATGIIFAPISPHHREQELYGLPAPTITTTLCLALGDAMAISLYECLEVDLKRRHNNFKRWHPGGAIGLANGLGESASDEMMTVKWSAVPKFPLPLDQAQAVDLWRSVALSPYLCADGLIHKSSDVIQTLEANAPLKMVPGFPLALAPQYRSGQGLCVYRDENGEPTGIVWD